MTPFLFKIAFGMTWLITTFRFGIQCPDGNQQANDRHRMSSYSDFIELSNLEFPWAQSDSCRRNRSNVQDAASYDGLLVCRTADMSSDWNCRIQYVMQWDTDKKKLIFDGQPIYRGLLALTPTGISRLLDPSDDPENEYSFEVPSWESLCAADDSASVYKRDALTHYQIEWDNVKKRFLVNGRSIEDKTKAFMASLRDSVSPFRER